VSRMSRKCGILNISQPYRTSRPVTGTFFNIFFSSCLGTLFLLRHYKFLAEFL
jgi:hypothetical protein